VFNIVSDHSNEHGSNTSNNIPTNRHGQYEHYDNQHYLIPQGREEAVLEMECSTLDTSNHRTKNDRHSYDSDDNGNDYINNDGDNDSNISGDNSNNTRNGSFELNSIH
jgi:hypothetical protein